MLNVKKLLNKMLDAIKVDYIVEEGTSGDWTYRKWNSGIAECWGTTSSGTLTMTAIGALFYSDIKSIAFPTDLFIEKPTCVGNVTGNNALQGLMVANSATTEDNFSYRVWKAQNTTTAADIMAYAIGKWK